MQLTLNFKIMRKKVLFLAVMLVSISCQKEIKQQDVASIIGGTYKRHYTTGTTAYFVEIDEVATIDKVDNTTVNINILHTSFAHASGKITTVWAAQDTKVRVVSLDNGYDLFIDTLLVGNATGPALTYYTLSKPSLKFIKQ